MNSPELRAELGDLTPPEQYQLITDLVISQFRGKLMMMDDEQLSPAANFFDLGLSSLPLMETKQQLEHQLDLGIDTAVLFNRPTLEQLVGYLPLALEGTTAAEGAA